MKSFSTITRLVCCLVMCLSSPAFLASGAQAIDLLSPRGVLYKAQESDEQSEVEFDEKCESIMVTLATTKGLGNVTGKIIPIESLYEASNLSDIQFRECMRQLSKNRFLSTTLIEAQTDAQRDRMDELGYPSGRVRVASLRSKGDQYVLDKGYAE